MYILYANHSSLLVCSYVHKINNMANTCNKSIFVGNDGTAWIQIRILQ